MLPEHFALPAEPQATPEAIIQAGPARFTVLSPGLLRLEYTPHGNFEDKASQAIWYRRQPVPAFELRRDDTHLEIETTQFVLRYQLNTPFNADSLSIRVKANDTRWRPGDPNPQNLRGTNRTLDRRHGFTPLSQGLISRAGWALLDDSQTLVFNDQHTVEPRQSPGIDWYFLAYGHDYKAALRDYCAISGRPPLIPRWILGNWWSRYWAYTQEELTNLLNDFQAHEIPLSVCIIDMDWHLTETGNDSSGWTGYTWNHELFPDPQAMINLIHQKGLRTALNLHPADGVHPHEAQYEAMARRLGLDPESGQPIPFDITDPDFINAYFELLHHPYEAMGVDFWWLDWQQGLTCKIPNLDPLWLLNHLHFFDHGRNGRQRPFIFSRWGNEGHQRYPIGFSGDSYISWESLRFQPYLTATASNVAYGWWSHDIGGHTSGDGDSELFARWVQFGAFSPILRIHTTKGYLYDQRPWLFESADVREVLQQTMQLRHALIPYLYTMAWRAHRDSLPLLLPLYYEHPETEAAYHCPQQYLFGSELLVAPFVNPIDPDTRLARQVVWLPEGDWFHFETGEYMAGNRWHAVYGTLKDIPIFAKAGAIVPLAPQVGWGGIDTPTELHLHVFAGADNQFTLYEDDGTSLNYRDGAFATTTISQTCTEQQLILRIDPVAGDADLVPPQRTLHLHLHGINSEATATMEIDGALVSPTLTRNAETETLHIPDLQLTPRSTLRLQLDTTSGKLLSRRDRRRETMLRLLRSFRLHTGVRNQLVARLNELSDNPDAIAPYLVTMHDAQIRALCEVLYEAGIHHIPDTHHPATLILWNNREDEAITYRYNDAFLEFGWLRDVNHQQGVVPRFAAIIPHIQTWTHGPNNEHVERTLWQAQVDYHNLATVREADRRETP